MIKKANKKKWPEAVAVILAAGRGTRMTPPSASSAESGPIPKALYPICGKPMLWFLLQAVEALGIRKILVVGGYGFEKVQAFLRDQRPLKTKRIWVRLVRQRRQLGSGHAVACAARFLNRFKGPALVLYCDTPLISSGELGGLLGNFRKNGPLAANFLSVKSRNPFGYGRVQRRLDGSVAGIIEEQDAKADEKNTREINVGCYAFDPPKLLDALAKVRKNPLKKEYYLTDAVGILAARDRVEAVLAGDEKNTLGVNTPGDFLKVQALMQEEILKRLMDQGVWVRDPRTTTIDADVRIGRGSVILPNTVIEEGSVIGKSCRIGPFARIRGGSTIGDGCQIGNFVEIVRSTVGRGALVKHLSYLGDAQVGKFVNIGAGTITANFDGKKKHRTLIKDRAQIGSGTILIAPVVVGRSARTGAGSVVTKNTRVPDGSVMVGVPARQLRKRDSADR